MTGKRVDLHYLANIDNAAILEALERERRQWGSWSRERQRWIGPPLLFQQPETAGLQKAIRARLEPEAGKAIELAGWGVCLVGGDFAWHNHTARSSWLAGVYYPARHTARLQFQAGTRFMWGDRPLDIADFWPEPGALAIFPRDLEHRVQTGGDSSERWSVAFNVNLVDAAAEVAEDKGRRCPCWGIEPIDAPSRRSKPQTTRCPKCGRAVVLVKGRP